MRLRAVVLLGLGLMSCSGGSAVRSVDSPHVAHAYWLTDRVISGAQPGGEAAFRELAALGVKTIISVDGVTPDLEGAHRNGLTYVHLPVGYDAIPSERALELAKAVKDLPGPIYLHCHHGQHRGPAAAAVACIGAGQMKNDRAIEALTALGTGPEYVGLWRSVREARRADDARLCTLKVEFRERAPVPPITEAMVDLDAALDRLKLRAREEVAPEAVRIREICTELMRTEEFGRRPEDFRKRMEATRDAAARLAELLKSSGISPESERAFAALRQGCADCHKAHRDGRGK